MGIPEHFSPEGYEGFVYLIVNTLTLQKYIGRKYFWSKRAKKLKGQKRRKRSITESDWRYYRSSCDELKDDINKLGLDNFEFHILSLHKTRGQTNYAEIREMFLRDVLFSKHNDEYIYYNTNIMNRYFRQNFIDKQ